MVDGSGSAASTVETVLKIGWTVMVGQLPAGVASAVDVLLIGDGIRWPP